MHHLQTCCSLNVIKVDLSNSRWIEIIMSASWQVDLEIMAKKCKERIWSVSLPFPRCLRVKAVECHAPPERWSKFLQNLAHLQNSFHCCLSSMLGGGRGMKLEANDALEDGGPMVAVDSSWIPIYTPHLKALPAGSRQPVASQPWSLYISELNCHESISPEGYRPNPKSFPSWKGMVELDTVAF